MLRHRLLPLLLAAAACHGLPAERPKPPRPSGPGRRCPHRNVTSQVINGRPIVEGSFPFPWLSWLGDSVSGQFCGGTLIAPGWVLTAAHCLWEELPLPPDPYAVDVQLHRRDYSLPIEEEAPAISVYAVEQHIHPDYDASSLFNDIALLRLNSTVPNDVATPVRLDTGSDGYPRPGLLAGWGSHDVQCRVYTTVMNEGDVDIETAEVCEDMAGRWYDHETQVCAGKQLGGGEWTEAGCGDSGGPLFVRSEQDGEFVEVGIVSWGYGDAPNVYTRVSAFLGWIEEVMDEKLASHE